MRSRKRTAALMLGFAVVACSVGPALARTRHAPSPAAAAAPAADSPAPGVTGELADWIAASDDNGGLPFLIVDKLGARVYAFDAGGAPLGSAPALVGLARGDDSPPQIRGLQLSQINDDQRTTPAGRFETEWGPSENHGTMLWVDELDAIAMHPVMSVNAGERRAERILSSDPNDHRISYGCINVPKPFYERVLLTALNGGNAIVYVMPDTKPIAEVFPAFAAAMDARIASSPDAGPGPLRVASGR